MLTKFEYLDVYKTIKKNNINNKEEKVWLICQKKATINC